MFEELASSESTWGASPLPIGSVYSSPSLSLNRLSHSLFSLLRSLSSPFFLSLSYGTHRPLPTSWFRSLSHRLKPISFYFIPFVFTFLFSHSLSLVQTLTHLHALTLSHKRTRTHALSHKRTHTRTLSCALVPTLHTHFGALNISLLFFHPHPHTRAYTHISAHTLFAVFKSKRWS